MLKQAMKELESLNSDILRTFHMDRSITHPDYRQFEKFTEDLVPFMLRQAKDSLMEDGQIGSPLSLLRLLEDCINKPVQEIKTQCMVCSGSQERNEPYRAIFPRDRDAVHEFELSVSRLAGHNRAQKNKNFGPYSHDCSCIDTLYVRSELATILRLSRDITTRVNAVFSKSPLGLSLPPTLQKSATYIPRYEEISIDLFEDQDYLDCLGRAGLHHYLDSVSEQKVILSFLYVQLKNCAHKDLLGRSPLHIVCHKFRKNLHVFDDLLSSSRINMQTVYGHTPLHYMLNQKSFFELKPLGHSLGFSGIDPSLQDLMGRNAFSYLLEDGNIENIDYFRDRFDIHPDSLRGPSGEPPILYAITKGHKELLKYLLSLPDIDPNMADRSGSTPLHEVINSESFPMLELLGKHPSLEWDKVQELGGTPLCRAARLKDNRFLEYILERTEDTDINHQYWGGRSLLHDLARFDDHEKIQLLLGRAAIDLNAQDAKCETPLMCAISHGSIKAARMLLRDKRTDLNVQNNHGKVVLDFARIGVGRGYEFISAYLEWMTRVPPTSDIDQRALDFVLSSSIESDDESEEDDTYNSWDSDSDLDSEPSRVE